MRSRIVPYVAVVVGVALVTAGCSSPKSGGSATSVSAGAADSIVEPPTTAAAANLPATTVPASSPSNVTAPNATTPTAATTVAIDAPAGDALVAIGKLPVAKVAAPVWGTCTNKQAAAIKLQCAVVKMPLDHADPTGKTFDLVLSKVKAKGPKPRGSMLVNPGGPGASGITYASSVANRMPKEITEAYDVIGFDARGTGESMPIDCVNDAFQDQSLDLDPTPEDDAERKAGEKFNLENECLAKYPDIDLFSTLRVIQDMDAVRAALGDAKLTYYGVSYGSYLGAAYASAFPDTVGNMVLDGAFLPETTGNQATIIQWGGFNKAFDNWITWCQKEKGCEFNDPDVYARFLKLADQLDTRPLTVGKRTVGEGVLNLAVIASLYSKFSWPVFASALVQAEQGSGAGLLALADSYNQRDPQTGKYEPLGEANTVISCASGISQPIDGDTKVFTEQVKNLGKLGRFVADVDWATQCNKPQPKIAYSGSQPIIVIGGENDPATPYSQALTLTAALGEKASLITFTGEGHGGLFESTCAKDAVKAYFVDGKVPDKGLKCEQAAVAKPSGALAALALPSSFVEIPLEEGSVLLGLDAVNFATRTFRVTGDSKTATDALLAALKQEGFNVLYTDAIPDIPDSKIGGVQKGADLMLLATFGPKAMQTSDLQSVSPLAGKDGALIILTVPATPEGLRILSGG
jgi:pimeloyl-ACP methyl ester carboxylesterase